jgi:hypothetical protein
LHPETYRAIEAKEKLKRSEESRYSIFTSGVYKATALDAAFPQEKPHFPEPDCAE